MTAHEAEPPPLRPTRDELRAEIGYPYRVSKGAVSFQVRQTEVGPSELIVMDEVEPCPYLEGHRARFPMRLPLRPLNRAETDARLAEGDRRYGRLLFRTECPTCRACEPIRVLVDEFALSRNHRRVLRRGDRELVVELGEPMVSPERIAIYERHKVGRGLGQQGERPIDAARYAGFLVDRSVDSFELRFYRRGELIGFAVTDRGATSLSAVYCAYDPDHAELSIGTYAILQQIALCREWGLRYLYLGLYIAANPHVRYKARFVPHERLIGGTWQRHQGPPLIPAK